jgi:hydrogenase maturation protein HypF
MTFSRQAHDTSSPTGTDRSDYLFSDFQHLEIHVSGTVQGVGFRPFVYNLARWLGLTGTVQNHSQGVTIHVEGPEERLKEFAGLLRSAAPPAARVDSLEAQSRPLTGTTEFRILPSEMLDETFTQVSPDLALCADCRSELEGLGERRKDYPFVNCTNCGPRFTIIQNLPYDRRQTTMSEFRLCDLCRAEYEDPEDRRFHAQPVACRNCGPWLQFLEASDEGWEERGGKDDALALAAAALKEHDVVLVQGIGGFHLACDALDERLVSDLRQRKHRDEKPFAVMFDSEESLARSCEASGIELAFLRSYRAPIMILKTKREGEIAEAVAPGNPCIGAMLPYSPLHVLLLREFGGPLVMTSANVSDEPIAYRVDDALERMSRIADAALVHNRRIQMFADDSVVKVIGGAPRVWRRSRGYVPEAVHVPEAFRVPTLAFGPQLKNTFCLGKQQFGILSQHLGDVENDSAAEAARAALDHFLHLYDAKIELAACDLHPDYTTTRIAAAWSKARGIPLVRVQHHHAHLAACLAENGRNERAIGLCLDGTGYGTDGTVWGGEALVGDFLSFERAGHLQKTVMLGGEKAAKEPWRMAVAWLYEAYGERCTELPLEFNQRLRSEYSEAFLTALLTPNLRTNVFPQTSSLGRLFDAVAALLFFGMRNQYEGQAAMLLEGMISPIAQRPYPMELQENSHGLILSPVDMIRAMASDLEAHVPVEIISRRFHEGIVDGFARLCVRVREESDVNVVALSGGCFQNAFLLTEFERRLTDQGFDVLSHQQIPPNDGGVALGQAVIANRNLKYEG